MQHWNAWDLVLVFLMWTIMMVAMMVPRAGPMILLFAEINRCRGQKQGPFAATGQFLCGYLTAWAGFSALASLAQWGLLTAALISPNDGSHEQSVSCRIAAHRRPLSVQPSEIRMPGSLPIADRFHRYGMAI
jgi:predicted metal-binding membrane protein